MSKPINGAQPAEWAKHLRPYGKRAFWKRHRALGVDDFEHVTGTAKKTKKSFGIKQTFAPGFISILKLGEYSIQDWFATERAREDSLKAIGKNRWNKPIKVEKVER